MLSTGFPIQVTQKRLQSQVEFVKRELDSARFEAVSGRRFDLFKSLGGQIGRVHIVEKQIADVDQRLTQIGLIKADFNFVQKTLEAATDAAANISTRIDAAVGAKDDTALEALGIDAESELRVSFSQLNVSFGGRQLFSGAATDTPPLASPDTLIAAVDAIVAANATAADVETALDAYFSGTGAGTFAGDIYQGSTTAGPSREITATRRVGVDIRADDQGFRDLFRGYALYLSAENVADETMRDALRSNAAGKIREGSRSLISTQTRLGSDENTVDTAETRLEAEKSTYETLLAELVTVDQFEAASTMTNLETQLQAIYLTTGRIQNLSLVNFLR